MPLEHRMHAQSVVNFLQDVDAQGIRATRVQLPTAQHMVSKAGGEPHFLEGDQPGVLLVHERVLVEGACL